MLDRPDQAIAAPAAPRSYSAIAVDGSQVGSDQHSLFRCVLVNLGSARLSYGVAPDAALASEPSLYLREDDFYLRYLNADLRSEIDNIRRSARRPNQSALLTAVRSIEEVQKLSALAETATFDGPTLLLIDNTLAPWGIRAHHFHEQVARPLEEQYLAALERIEQAAMTRPIVLAGYISRPDGARFVDTLRLAAVSATEIHDLTEARLDFADPEPRSDVARRQLAPDTGHRTQVSGKDRGSSLVGVPASSEPEPADRLRSRQRHRGLDHPTQLLAEDRGSGEETDAGAVLDRELFGELLVEPGQRSTLFYNLETAGAAPAREIAFFYLNTGEEIARIEVPGWVSGSAERLQLAYALVWDQARRGYGYPVALAEAHEQAVVGFDERAEFWYLLEEALVSLGLAPALSAKNRAKRLRAV
jgi:hypothetical protein